MDILRCKRIDIELLQETFLIEKSPLYFDIFNITKLNVDIQSIIAEPNGMISKIRIKNLDDNNLLTKSSVYLEPNRDL